MDAYSSDWAAQGQRHIWLPYTQMQTATPPLPVVRTAGSRIELADGRTLIDGVASWWTACHGYNHPHIADAVRCQLDTMPHVMFGGLVHEPALRLASRLATMLGGDLERVFYTDSGSVAVEVAMKMAVQYWLNQGEHGRTRFLAFRGGYHGDTLGTMAVCDPEEGMHARFAGMLIGHDIVALPGDDEAEAALDDYLARHVHELAGILVEPLVQGAGGMLMHDSSVLQRLRRLADRHGLLLIFDEIFTGFGRTGTMFAFQQAGVRPDIVTLSKALTGGTLPLAATVASRRIFEGFLSDDPGHALMHGPTFMGNALACAAANASLDLFEQEPRLAQVAAIEGVLRARLMPLAALPWVADVRVLGAIGVVELRQVDDREALKRRFADAGVWIRPFGRIAYVTPAFTIAPDELAFLLDAMGTVLAAGQP
ncbi:adenosylmethionine--8-amino-7-oxononanoate transaminase [Kerstersia gyiorum]|jgi:adenosylmethionine-8-amino-7-oxononanoate aminotransferase|uniref:Adenosylmethionine-8-amino-7-oxononanoate aminotransferase n=1 Tax=Kerstersia gyiorum TaxID=206506 RepID=A0A171KPR4_9BURK|nr:adenosylmethionine--8-amino-7-oxononanoate transaminase [Kerstersia gyiorum]MCO7636826.1 adenosylmethionine--8-amino-7-oxononanoate transaminase [Pseudomonas sp. S 311-6]KAB0544027.1 adenosylmethionine--8-amino-7-oxononanoate transaminase [Kerstersia gyiorum]KKO70881.1 adenosylmethionine-8-amino-7-oxononanoate aminotransferase [Kerstersia gyiorum]MCH4270330.1 adenosylmethionine--8-amino-7-oxononanoate transaminase [Kerstersia gyiorum]MCI1228742.1 adenosylmethionine--8-amino-7-oxononanoate t